MQPEPFQPAIGRGKSLAFTFGLVRTPDVRLPRKPLLPLRAREYRD